MAKQKLFKSFDPFKDSKRSNKKFVKSLEFVGTNKIAKSISKHHTHAVNIFSFKHIVSKFSLSIF